MKFVHRISSTGMLHREMILIKLQNSMWKIFTTLIAEGETDVFAIGEWKAEFHSLIQKLSKLIGRYQRNGGLLNIKVSKNGGWEKPLKAWTFFQTKFFGERKRPFLTVWVQKKNHGFKLSKKEPKKKLVMKI